MTSTRSAHFFTALAFALVAGFVLAGCGSDGDDESSGFPSLPLFASNARAITGGIQPANRSQSELSAEIQRAGRAATWQGIMVGSTRSDTHFVQGNARIHIDDLAAPNVDVEFTNIKDLQTGVDIAAAIRWNDLPLTDGAFSATSGGTDGIRRNFYGSNHEEVGGVFDHSGIVGGFGAARN